jgi:hypothetical protein
MFGIVIAKGIVRKPTCGVTGDVERAMKLAKLGFDVCLQWLGNSQILLPEAA